MLCSEQVKYFSLLLLLINIFRGVYVQGTNERNNELSIKNYDETSNIPANIASYINAKLDLLRKDIGEVKPNEEIELKLQNQQRELDNLSNVSKLVQLSFEDLKFKLLTTPENNDNSKINQQPFDVLSDLKTEIKTLVEQFKTLTHVLHVNETEQCEKDLSNNVSNSDNVIATNCQHAMLLANSTKDAVLTMKLPNNDNETYRSPYFCAFCHYAESGSWLLIQRRQDGTVDFHRNWNEYKTGFGNVNGEFWLGLERIHQITKNGNYELWILLKYITGREQNEFYSEFQVADENEKYKLTISGHSGGLDDSMEYNNGKMFSTYDKDNHDHEYDLITNYTCAEVGTGGWWFRGLPLCYETHLNGLYSYYHRERGILWTQWPEYWHKVTYVHLAIRPQETNEVNLPTNIASYIDSKFDMLRKDIEEVKSNQQREQNNLSKLVPSETEHLKLKPQTNPGNVDDNELNQKFVNELASLTTEIKSLAEQFKWLTQALSAKSNKVSRPEIKATEQCLKDLRTYAKNRDKVLPQNCQEEKLLTDYSKNGVFAMRMPNTGNETTVSPSFCAYCYFDETGHWLLIQRREWGLENFNRSWEDYKTGFGDLQGDFWLGLERIHQITKNGNYELWISLDNHNVFYSTFRIDGENEKYRLTIYGYTGIAGDSMQFHNGKMFTTYDNDNDEYDFNCAREHSAGWWYGGFHECFRAHLNGPYDSNEHGMKWLDFPYDLRQNTIRRVHLAIRPVKK